MQYLYPFSYEPVNLKLFTQLCTLDFSFWKALKQILQEIFVCISVEEHIKDQLDAGKPAPVVEEVDLANLAPRKPDW